MFKKFLDVPTLCESCGLPIVPGKVNNGTLSDGRPALNYCEFCLQNNKLLNEGKTADEMVEWMTQVYIERFGWKNHKNAKKEARERYKTMQNILHRGRGMSAKVKLILLAIFIIIGIILRLIK